MGDLSVAWWRQPLREMYSTPLVVWSCVVAYASLSPPSRLPSLEWDGGDKVAHGLMYAVLAALMLRAWVRHERATAMAAVATVAVCAAWGAYLECLQELTPDRYFEVGDLLANALGAGVGILSWVAWRRAIESRRRADTAGVSRD